jgi:Na+/H+ antiporter NhaD/arsenite permease-like protein
VSTRKKEKEKPKPRAVFLSLIYFLIIVGVAYFISDFVMKQVDLGDLLTMKLPLINRRVPRQVFQLALAVAVFFVLQFLFVFTVGLLGGKKKEEDLYKPNQY